MANRKAARTAPARRANDARSLLQRLLDYIREQAKDVDPRAYVLTGHKGFLRRRPEIAGLPGVEFDVRVEGDHTWMRVQRLEVHPPPPLTENQKGLFRVSQDPDGALPVLDETGFQLRLANAAEGKTPEARLDLETRGRIATAKALYIYTQLWVAWAEAERPRRATIALYGELFSLRQELAAEETARPQELVWGIGVTSWQLEFEELPVGFEYPLLTQTVEIALDEQTLALELRPRSTDTRVELDAVIACQVTGAADVERAMREYLTRHKDKPVTPFDASSYIDVLKLAAGNLDSKGSYRDVLASGKPVPAPSEHVVVTDAWVMFSRSRSNNYLFDDLKRLHRTLQNGCEIPAGPLALVTPPSDEAVEAETVRFRGISSGGNVGVGPLEQLFFALPYNDEQETIVQRLEHAPGVTVQGPPGTGKTHTIANIICHYLALGRRVLVTSRGETALEVLQSKIPEEVRPLTVALLSGDREGVRQFQASIEAIQHRVSQLNPEQSRRDIETLQEAIGRAHAELGRIDGRIDEIAHVQLSEMDVDGVQLRAQQLAELVVSGRAQHGWFADPLSLTDEHAPPLSDEDARALREARRALGPDLAYILALIPSADDLPGVTALADLHDVLARIRTIEGEVASGELMPLKTTTPELLSAARELLARVEEARALANELQAVDGGWPLQLRGKCSQPSFASERKALESLFPELDILTNARAAFLQRPVEFPDEGLVARKTREAVARGVQRGRPFGFLAFGHREAKAHIASVRVAGRVPRGTDDWTHVNRYVVLQEVILSFVVRWNHLAEELSMPQLRGGVSALREIELVANTARKAHRMATEYDAILPRLAETVFERAPARELAGTADELNGVRNQLLRHLVKAELSRAAIQLTELQEACAGKTGPVSDSLRAFIADELGHLDVPTERAAARYAEIIAELRRIATLSVELAIVRDLARRIADAGAPKFASRIVSEPVATDGEDRAFPTTWRAAWNWARMRSFLDSIDARQELLTIAARRRDLEAAISRLYTEVVAKAAWLATKRNANPKVLQALAGYVTAIRRIGQGTGPNATRHRRDAREAMQDAAGAVPCWIMSHARISEAMPAEIGAFDLVIVDEASQSDLWALPAILRGKKILVVGDDKQVAPDGGFIASLRIQQFRDRFLSGQPYEAEMTPDKSLYELASRAFAAEQVMLREHFRCVPPIIAYSNRVFYKGQIHPLRIPKASERIDPPLVDIYVDGGERDSRDCNEKEAIAVSEEIVALLDDVRFANRTIGVVSLLGIEQAKRIDELVRTQCDPADLLRRRFQCGDARTFQGSERDIIFLSMVVDPGNCKALSGNLFDQRFNVAASRARDRMYLVRSVKASDLSDRDLRRSLLLHFSKPLVGDQGREGGNLMERCESEFERQVFSALASRGYRVIPQVRAGDHRIDMVVEGASDTRLAVECDGDDLHGADRWQQDTKRQRVLERAGWTFWRCFASTWYMRRDEVLGELLERLSVMGIEPLGALERAPGLVERRVWMAQQPGREDRDDAGAALEEAMG